MEVSNDKALRITLTSAELRVQLDKLFPLASDLERFLIDYFPNVMHRASPGMDRVAKVNLLMQISALEDIEQAIRQYLNLATKHKMAIVSRTRFQGTQQVQRFLSWRIRSILLLLTLMGIYGLQFVVAKQHVEQKLADSNKSLTSMSIVENTEHQSGHSAEKPKAKKSKISLTAKSPSNNHLTPSGNCRKDQDRPEELIVNGIATCLDPPKIEIGDRKCNCPMPASPQICDLRSYGDISEQSDAAFPIQTRKRYQDIGLRKCSELLIKDKCEQSGKISSARYCFCCLNH